MKPQSLYVLMLFMVLSSNVLADCRCGPKCVKYSDASHCTRCCTGTLKRSLNIPMENNILRGHRFLLPKSSDSPYRTPMWLQSSTSRQKGFSKRKRDEKSVDRLLHELNAIVEALDEKSSDGFDTI